MLTKIMANVFLPLLMPLAAEQDGVEVSSSQIPSGGKAVKVDYFEPRVKGKYPAIIMLHGADGLPRKYAPLFKSHAESLARQGYAVLILYYFDRTDTRVEDGKLLSLPLIFKHFQTWVATVGDAITYAGTLPNVDARRIGLV